VIFSIIFLGKAEKGFTFAPAFEPYHRAIRKRKSSLKKRLEKVCFRSGKGSIFAARFDRKKSRRNVLKK